MVTLALALMLLAAVADKPTADGQVRSEDVQQAIRDLGNPSFSVRQRASDLLWRWGPAVQEDLERAVQSGDREVVYRARAILDKFRYGIYADTPDETVALINQFREGSAESKREALEALLRRKDVDVALLLMRLDPVEEVAQWIAQNADQLVPTLIVAGKDDQAQELLEQTATTPEAMGQYAAFLLQRGKLEEQIDRLSGQLGPPTDPGKTTLLAILLRARGDLEAAYQVSQSVNTEISSLQDALRFEMRNWQALAAGRQNQFDANRVALEGNVQFLGYLAAFHRLAGNQPQFEETVNLIKKLAEDQPEQHWYCTEALLINDRLEDAIRLLIDHDKTRAFSLLIRQGRMDEAFRIAGVDDLAQVKTWFQETVLELQADQPESKLRSQFELALQVAKELHRLGLEQDAVAGFTALANAVRHDDARMRRLVLLCQAEMEVGLTDLAFEHGSMALDEQSLIYMLQTLFPDQNSTARLWWNWFRERQPQQDRDRTLQAIRPYLDPAAEDLTTEQVLATVRQVANNVANLPGGDPAQWRIALAETCRIHGLLDEAEAQLRAVHTVSAEAALKLADMLAERDEWWSAAEQYRIAWDLDNANPLPLLLYGLMLQKGGEVEKGQQQIDLACRLPVTSRSRYEFAEALRSRDLEDLAAAQWELQLRTADFQSWFHTNAAQHLGNRASGQDDAAAADLWETQLLASLEIRRSFVLVEGYLQLQFLIQKARGQALLANGQVEQGIEQLRRAEAALPSSTQLPEDTLPLLAAVDRRDVADQLIERSRLLNEAICKQFPRAALYHNNLAWMLARCDRRLDEARHHAETAVSIEPDSPTYLDTLAEVLFRQGETQPAIELARRCVRLAPDKEHYSQQLERFLAADR